MTTRRALFITTLLAFGLSAASALAGPVVLYGPGLDSSQAGVIAKQRLKTGEFVVAGSLVDRIGVKGGVSVAVGAPYESCARPAKRPLKGEFLRVEQQMAQMEYGNVRKTIHAITERVACYGADADRDDLFKLFFTQGIAAFYDEDVPAAQAAFSRAVAIDPSRPWPTEYPPTAKPAYDEALRLLTASPPSKIVSEIEGDIMLDGAKDDGKPRLYVGGHLVFVPSSSTSMWVDIPAAPAMSEEGLLITTAANLLLGLLDGNDLYAPWLALLAEKEGWTEIALVGTEDVVVYKDGSFFKTSGEPIKREHVVARSMREGSGPTPATIAGLVLVGVGAGTAGVGLGLNMSAYKSGIPTIDTTLIPQAQYLRLKTQNSVGLGLAAAGAGIAVAGAVVTVIGLLKPASKVAAVPWLTGGPDGVAFGVAGSLP